MAHAAHSTAYCDQSLSDIVLSDARAATVFDRYGLDYCCHGHRPLAQAASESGVPLDEVTAALTALGEIDTADHADRWPELDALTRHIVETHHAFVRQMAPSICAWLDKLVARHGERHPELAGVRETFRALTEELSAHLLKEENILFPYVDALAIAARTSGRLPSGPFGTVLNPVRLMEDDHQETGEALAMVRRLTHGFIPPEDACTTFRLCYDALADFEADVHRHIHLENHLLFPRAIELEHQLTGNLM